MKNVLENLFGFLYSMSMGDYFFFLGTFLLIVLFVYVIYLIKCSELEESNETPVTKSKETFDLEKVVDAIESDYKPGKIELTHYEEEQENTAIISYEELVKNKNRLGINYDDEYIFEAPELAVKKISLSKDAPIEEQPKLEVKLMQYDKEEAFLKALKELQNNLSQ